MAELDIERIIPQLTLNEKASLLAGIDLWHTQAIPRVGIPSIRMSDGPNGVRGTRFFNGVPAACVPCETALGSTFDADLIHKLGHLLGEECKAKGAAILLGPTINMQRGPLGGRGFESFSEDPVLSGNLASSYCVGVKETDVIPTPKHLVCNDQEHERMAVNAIVTERALREIYLLPFQLALKGSDPGAIMTAYNKVNGTHASESPRILQDIVRGEWGYKGFYMSDWFGVYSVSASINAGLDIEMPGPTRFRGSSLVTSRNANQISEKTIDDRVTKVLEMVNLSAKSGIPENAPEKKLNRPEDRALLRRAAGESIVLLKNDDRILPLDPNKKTLVLGPNSNVATYCGGGSAGLPAYYTVTPRQAITEKCSGNVTFTQGAYGHKELPLIGDQLRTENGEPGFMFRVYLEPPSEKTRQPVDEIHLTSSNAFLMDYVHPQITSDLFYVTLNATFEPPESGIYDFGLTLAGTGLLYIDGELIVDNKTEQRQGESFFGIGTVEERGSKYLEAGKKHQIYVEYATAPTSKLKLHGVVSFGPGGIRVGGCRQLDPDHAIKEAVKLAGECDQVVVCVGLNSDWESEGYDRPHMGLPPRSDELVEAVLEAQPKAAVVVQSGTPVAMPWADKSKALLQAWYGGNETGNGIADVLFGDVNPAAKLSLTFPKELRHNPTYLSFRSERGRVLYSEDVYVGYRYYDKVGKEPLFRFGHGLSYTSFRLSDLAVSQSTEGKDIKGESVEARVSVENVGSRAGAEVVQLYVLPPANASVGRPVKELKGFQKVMLQPGEKKSVSIVVPKGLATSFWDEDRSEWSSEKGAYTVEAVGTGPENTLSAPFTVEKTRFWGGL